MLHPHRLLAIAIAIGAGACARAPVPTWEACETVTSVPYASAAWSGPSPDEVVARVAATTHTVAVWDSKTLEAPTSSAALAVSLDAATAVVVTREGEGIFDCRPGSELVVEGTLSADIGGGEAVGEVPVTFGVSEADPDTLHVRAWDVIALSPAWEALAIAEIAPGDDPSLLTSTEWRLSVKGGWEAPLLGVAAQFEAASVESRAVARLWAGHLTP